MNSVIKKGAIISYIAIFLNISITFFYTPWMIRKIGVSDYGLYSLILSFISYFIMDFGLHQAIQRFIAKYRAEKNEDKVEKIIGITTRVYLIIDIVIFSILFILYFFISNIFNGLTINEIQRLKKLYVIASIFSVLNFMFKPMTGAMIAFEFFVEEKLLEMINKVGIVVIVCIALYFGADIYALVLINGSISLIVSILKFYVFTQKSKLQIQWTYFNYDEMKNVFSFSMWTFGCGIAQRLRLSIIPSVLGIISNSSEIAIFAMGMSLEGLVYTISSAINGLFLPTVSRMAHNDRREEILNLMIQVGRIQLIIISMIFSGFLIFGKQFILLWIGYKFLSVYWVLIFLIVSNLISLTQQIALDLVYVENKIKDITIRIFLCSMIGFIITCFCARKYGAIGCAFGTGVGLCLYQLLINLFYYKSMRIDIKTFFVNCHIKILPIIIIITCIFYFICNKIQFNNWINFIVMCLIYSVTFCVFLYLFVLSKEERRIIDQFFIKLNLSCHQEK